jgi:hypothetical protein
MRSIDATLLTQQKALRGKPTVQVIIGTAPNTVDVSAFVVEYEYEEADRQAGLTLILDNSDNTFNTLSGDYANIAQGAEVELKRGLTVTGTAYVEELPTTYIEQMSYDYGDGESVYILECLDFWGLLARWRAASVQTWSGQTVTTILEWLLTQVSLTRESGSMTALSLNFQVALRETGYQAARRLVAKVPEYLHPGLDGEVKWREIDGGDASQYTFGWNANHPLIAVSAGDSAWQSNSITVKGKNSTTGTASDATQISNVGTRTWTIYDGDLDANAECTQRAQAQLDLQEANATEALLVCRPCHGLELYDVVTIDSPPWGGSNVVGRVVQWAEFYDIGGDWYQRIFIGAAPQQQTAPDWASYQRMLGKSTAQPKTTSKRKRSRRKSRKRRKRKSRKRRRISSWQRILREIREIWQRLQDLIDALIADGFMVPIGAIVLWSGATDVIPPGWVICDGNNGTPDLRGKFVVGAGDAYAVNDTGGADEVDISHVHTVGTLVNDSQGAHTHTSGTYATDSDAHTPHRRRRVIRRRICVQPHPHRQFRRHRQRQPQPRRNRQFRL